MTSENHKKVTFRAEDFQYPTKEEIRFADSQCPKFSNFGFEDKPALLSVFDGLPMDIAANKENLFWWDIVLTNRFGSLRGAYYDSLTHFNRGFKDDYRECSESEMINRLLFDNNAEVFYYFFFVTADVIAQILNAYFRTKIPEDKVALNETLIKRISEPKVKNAILNFRKETKIARDYRNGFTHRYPSNYPDYRTRFEIKEGKEILHWGSGTFVPPTKIIVNIEYSLNSLSVLMNELKTSMVKIVTD